ncbi:LPS translocon maturation chaperone LptM [Rhodoferax sp.]|uniref:LPS translocon maturation chaperone LptM n=1 Tax=Rhodoferax sp. TaxID=50421 RepID=UPI002ACE9B99|nr:lipoprotein [Rhodoferax sp.]MDZ7918999.1 lipoprotein [Rhodoferax sp.]
MLKAAQILVRPLALAVSVLTVAACGQTGSLYLPSKSESRSPAATSPATPANTTAPTTTP